MISEDFVKKIWDFLDIIKEFKINIDKEKLSLKTIADCYTQKIDKTILEQEQEFNWKYIAGELKIFYENEINFGITISLYFQDKNEEWQKTKMSSRSQKMKYLNSEAIDRLRKERTVVFEITPPEKNA